MKRQKRDMLRRAYVKGYHAGQKGKSKEICPHESVAQRQEWLGGWRQAREDQWEPESHRDDNLRLYAS